jgi:S-adenosylmethionine-diacylgycerolhomoserine-N-methlytransferase
MTAAAHSDLMDSVYRPLPHIHNFHANNLFLRDRLIRQLDVKPGERVVEIGCDTARNPDQDRTALPRRYAL